MPSPRIVSYPDKRQLGISAAQGILSVITDSLNRQEKVHLSLTGGTMGIAVLAELAQLPELSALDLSRVHFWWSDERFLASGDKDRNEQQARDALLSRLGIPEKNLHTMGASNGFGSSEEAAAAYSAELASFAGIGEKSPVFDLLLLGMGPDGHIASLFPHRPEIQQCEEMAIAVYDSPKPPSTRVSLTLPVINSARRIWFLISGADKADATSRLKAAAKLEDSGLTAAILDETPAAGARASRGESETLIFVTDDALAASH